MLRAKLSSTVAVLLCATALSTESRAGLVSLCEFQPAIDYECRNCTPTKRDVPVALFDYHNQGTLQDISQIEFTVSMQVGDPANSHLSLGIDGIDTGLALNGFSRDTLTEKTFSMHKGDANWLSPQTEAQLLNALKDGQALASVIGATPDDTRIQLYSDTQTNLCITGNSVEPTPEPASLLAWAAAIAVSVARRRKAA